MLLLYSWLKCFMYLSPWCEFYYAAHSKDEETEAQSQKETHLVLHKYEVAKPGLELG